MTIVDILLLAMGAYLVLMVYTLSRPRSKTTFYFMLVLLISLIWDLTYYLELTLPTLEAKIYAHLPRFLFMPWLTFCWIAMICELFGVGKWLPRWFWCALAIYNVLTMAVAITSPFHNWFQYGFAIHPVGESWGVLSSSNGVWYRIYLFIQSALAWFGLALMFSAWSGASSRLRRALWLLMLGYGVPLVANVLWVLGMSLVPYLNLAPFTTGIAISAFAWMVLGYRALDIIPIARSVLMDNLSDLVFVLDRQGRIVDLNAAALKAVGRSPSAWLGEKTDKLPAPWAALLRAGPGVHEVKVAEIRRWYEQSAPEIRDARGTVLGRLFALRDVTLLRQREQELRLILDSISEAVFIHDAAGRLRTVNRPMLAMYGLPDEATALQYDIFNDYSAPDNNLEIGRAAIERCLRGERVVIPRWKARCPRNGKLFDVRVVVQAIAQDEEQLILATVMDITEELAQQQREVAYHKLLEEKRHLRQLELLIRDLHDGVGGIVAGISMISALGLKSADGAQREQILRRIMDLAGEANVEVRSLMNTLESREFFWPDLITEFRRHGAMMQENHGIAFNLTVSGAGDADGPGLFAGMSLFRIFKEALNNVVKHAAATQVTVELFFTEDRMRLVIADNGRGLSNVVQRGRGLRNMRQRITELGGELTTSSASGTRLEFVAPIPLKSPDQGIDGLEGE